MLNKNSIPQMRLRYAKQRGFANHGWLKSFHTFSFADYYDSRHMGFRSLRVINEDEVAASMGFGSHPHQNMEILSYVISGELKHKDSLGHESIIRPGEVQKISAGTGISHSEFNASSQDSVHFLQIWIIPERNNVPPAYEQYALPAPDPKNPLLLIGSSQGGLNVVQFHQDIVIYRGVLSEERACQYHLKAGRGVWLQMVKGKLLLDSHSLEAGDGAAIENVQEMTMKAQGCCEFLLFDMK